MHTKDELENMVSDETEKLDVLRERYDLALENGDPRSHVLLFVIEHKEKTLSFLLEQLGEDYASASATS